VNPPLVRRSKVKVASIQGISCRGRNWSGSCNCADSGTSRSRKPLPLHSSSSASNGSPTSLLSASTKSVLAHKLRMRTHQFSAFQPHPRLPGHVCHMSCVESRHMTHDKHVQAKGDAAVSPPRESATGEEVKGEGHTMSRQT